MDQIAGLLVDGQLSQEAYDRKFKEISIEKGKLQKEKEELDYKGDSEANAIKNLEAFRKAAVEHNGKKMDAFMPEIFDACVEKIIVGGKDDAGNPDPYMMTFIFKKGFGPTLQANKGDLHGKLFTPILSFDHFWRHVTFIPMGDAERQKIQKDFIKVVVAVDFS
jgi:hypothetical protein